MKIVEAERDLKQQLKEIYRDNEAAVIASIVIEHVTTLSRTEKLSNKEKVLTDDQLSGINSLAERLLQHEPIQYVLNKAPFYEMELFVDSSVLIPRPETEELVEWVLKDLKLSHPDLFEKGPTEADETKTLKILDVGTGSGCIALALKKNVPKAEVWGCDISDEALNVARRNGSALDIRVDFQGVDILDFAQHKLFPTVDVIVSNPPYIPAIDKEQMNENVVKYEPHTALFVPHDDALIFYKALADFSKHRLYENGSIYMEINEDLSKEVTGIFEKEGYKNIEVRKDMQGKNRMVRVS